MNKWHKCYEESWKDHIVPESFQHPAKMAYGLLKRILDHCKDEGWGGVIVDPFGGIGSTGILGAYEGYQVICCELEQKFVDLAEQNFKLHDNAWHKFGNPRPIILQGDSRKLCELVESADIIVSSPPYQEQVIRERDIGKSNQGATGGKHCFDAYGHTPGQLGSMKAGKLDLILSSPPYAEIAMTGGKKGPEKYKTGLTQGKRCFDQYGQTKGNLGNLKAGDVGLILSSPPYEGALGNRKHEGDQQKYYERQKRYNEKHPEHKRPSAESMCYPCSDGNIASNSGDTFWQSAKEILIQCHKILRPGGHAIWVCKDFVRKGKRVTFSDDWQRLCESVGFKLVCRHQAMLVKEESHPGLFGDSITKTTERKSFFRRLAEAKGSPKIDWEDVICMERRPVTA